MMSSRHCMVLLTAVSALLACSDEDTIVSLNVTAGDALPVVDRLHVAITQGSRSSVSEFTPPTETSVGADAASPSIKGRFFVRIALTDGWKEANALVEVEARHADGTPFDPPIADETTVEIQPQGVVAAFVELGATTSGIGGMAGEAGSAGAGNAGVSGSAGAGGSNAGAGNGG